jgi:hypothetical protein
MNLFIKTKIESILDDKLKSGEILFYKLKVELRELQICGILK